MVTCDSSCGCHLKPWALGLAIGIIWGLCILIMGLFVHYEVVRETLITNGNVYFLDYGPTVKGSIVGGLIGFIHGFIKGFLIAWLYNIFTRCCKCCRKTNKVVEVVQVDKE